MLRYCFIIVAAVVFAGQVLAQDNVAPRVNEKIKVTGGERTDFVFTRAVIVTAIDSVPYDVPRSGTYSVGLGYGLPVGKALELKIEPRATWHKLYFRPTDARWFPASVPDSTVIYEKHRAFFAELPVGLKFKLARNKVSTKYQMLLEAGFSFGYNFGSTVKIKSMTNVDDDPELEGKATFKVNRIWELNKFRYGPYMRIGTRYVSLFAYYRMNDIYLSGATFTTATGGSRAYPKFPRLEFGLSVTI